MGTINVLTVRQGTESIVSAAVEIYGMMGTLGYSMTVKLLTECHLEFLSLIRSYTGLSGSTLAKCHIVGNHCTSI